MKISIKIFLFTITSVLYGIASAQSLRINKIDVYGNRKISTRTILSSINKKEGDSINPAVFKPETIISALKRIPGIKHVKVDPLCCDRANGYVLYIGIAESDAVVMKYRPSPNEQVQLPPEMIAAYRNFNQAVRVAVGKGEGSEAYSNGYSLLHYAAARSEQDKFIGFAKHNLQLVIKALKHSKSAEQRAAAAQIIAYCTDKKKVVECLLHAIEDADEDVRNNATRALSILANYLSEHPEIKVTIPATPFIRMLNSISWSDRNKGAMVLAQLTQSRDSNVLEQIEKQALPSLIEMAKWKNREHAIFSFMILGRIAGEDEASLFAGNFSDDYPSRVETMSRKCDYH